MILPTSCLDGYVRPPRLPLETLAWMQSEGRRLIAEDAERLWEYEQHALREQERSAP